mmetsp:Transcript_16263/g.49694  ORF Transcript_16263/g.49694 Transcript_16263/m.49694 type:complete len:322 (-) Transcript_16263:323-1288(-)
MVIRRVEHPKGSNKYYYYLWNDTDAWLHERSVDPTFKQIPAKDTPIAPSFAAHKSEAAEPKRNGLLNNYSSYVGSLQYFCTHSRPDIAVACQKLSEGLVNPTKAHVNLLKRVIGYLKGSGNRALVFSPEGLDTMVGYADASWDVTSVTGFLIGFANALFAWKCARQGPVSTSSMHSELEAIVTAMKEIQFFRDVLLELQCRQDAPTVLYNDNTAAELNTKRARISGKTKHIALRYAYARQAVQHGLVRVEHMPGNEMPADMLTKPLLKEDFERQRDKFLVECQSIPELRNAVEDSADGDSKIPSSEGGVTNVSRCEPQGRE